MWKRIQSLKGFHWGVLLLIGILSTLAGVAVFVYLAIALTPKFSHPLGVEVIDSGVYRPLCAGEMVKSKVELTINGAVLIDVFWSVAQLDENTIYLGDEVGTITRPPADKVVLKQDFYWLVPVLPAGDYQGIRTYWVRSGGSRPVFARFPFEVNGSC